ncbi:MAG: transporter substrate-binding domain-containing protein [Betaproteobacteria bacterium]
MLRRIVLLAYFTLFSIAHSSAIDTIVLSTEQWEPYIAEHLPDNGFLGEIVRESFKRSGYAVKYRFFPWARVVAMSNSGEVDGYLPAYYSQERELASFFSEPFSAGFNVFFKMRALDVSYIKLEDLKPYRIGVVRGYVNEEKFDQADFLQKDYSTDNLTNVKKLSSGRIDLFVADKYVGLYLLKNNFPDLVNAIDFIENPLSRNNLYVCISRKTANAALKVKAFNNGLKLIKADGTYQRILNKHGLGRM